MWFMRIMTSLYYQRTHSSRNNVNKSYKWLLLLLQQVASCSKKLTHVLLCHVPRGVGHRTRHMVSPRAAKSDRIRE